MLLIGIKSITTGTGYTEQDYSQVTHQQTDILKEGYQLFLSYFKLFSILTLKQVQN